MRWMLCENLSHWLRVMRTTHTLLCWIVYDFNRNFVVQVHVSSDWRAVDRSLRNYSVSDLDVNEKREKKSHGLSASNEWWAFMAIATRKFAFWMRLMCAGGMFVPIAHFSVARNRLKNLWLWVFAAHEFWEIASSHESMNSWIHDLNDPCTLVISDDWRKRLNALLR